MMLGSVPLLLWLLLAVAVVGVGGIFLWRRWHSGIMPLAQESLTPQDTAALGFICLARYQATIALPGDGLYPVHGILHFRRLPRDFRLLPSSTLKAHLQPVRWVCCLQSVDLYRVVMRLHFERHIAGHLFQITEQEFCSSVRLATMMVPGARILNQSAQAVKATAD